MRRIITLLLTAVVVAAQPCRAEVLVDWQDNDAGIVLRGEITPETNFELVEAWIEIKSRGGKPLALILDSPGGSVYWSEKISSGLTNIHYPAMVLAHGLCASACFLLLAAVPQKLIASTALIAIHSASINGQESPDSYAATMEMARLAAGYGIPDALVGKLVRTPGYDISPLSVREILSIPGAKVAPGRDNRSFTNSAVPIDERTAGYSAGAYIAAGLSDMASCSSFTVPDFVQGCAQGLADKPPPGWDKRLR